METIVTPTNIAFVIMLLSVMFNVFQYINKPREAMDKHQALTDQEVDNKAAVLAKDLESEKHATERRFNEMREKMDKNFTDIGARMDKALELAMNHTHTVDVKVDTLTKDTGAWHLEISKQMTRMSTIIEERIPKK